MRSRILSAGLAAVFLPGTCSPIDGLLSPGLQGPPLDVVAPLDGGFMVKGFPLLLQAADEEPEDVPDGTMGST